MWDNSTSYDVQIHSNPVASPDSPTTHCFPVLSCFSPPPSLFLPVGRRYKKDQLHFLCLFGGAHSSISSSNRAAGGNMLTLLVFWLLLLLGVRAWVQPSFSEGKRSSWDCEKKKVVRGTSIKSCFLLAQENERSWAARQRPSLQGTTNTISTSSPQEPISSLQSTTWRFERGLRKQLCSFDPHSTRYVT